MGTEAFPSTKLHIFFFPYVTCGHFHPMLNLASLFSFSPNISSTIITTPSNAHLLSHFRHLILPLPSTCHLPNNWDSLTDSTLDLLALHSALSLLQTPFLNLLKSNTPDCLVSDMFLPWTADVAADLNIPRIVFHGMSAFSLSVIASVKKHRPQDSVSDNLDPFIVPGLPREIVLTRSQLPVPLRTQTPFNSIMDQMDRSNATSYGVIINSFAGLEHEFAEHYRNSLGGHAWLVGPVMNPINQPPCSDNYCGPCLSWLDSKETDSVIYMCFGSQAQLSTTQLSELVAGLASTKHYFVLVVKNDSREFVNHDQKGLVIRGWAPQIRILNHESVGGFLTHCGWNSILEGVSAGKPMVTWPVFGDQPLNEKLIVDELKVGVRVGVEIGSHRVVSRVEIASAVENVMGRGDEAMEMRRNVNKLKEEAREAVKEGGGSSWKDLNHFIDELMNLNKDLIIGK